MALAFTNLTALQNGADATTYSTASVSPSASSLILVAVYGSRVGGNVPSVPTVTSAFATGGWTQEADIPAAGGNMRLTVFSAVTTGTPGSGAVTADYGATTHAGCVIIVDQVTGQHATPTTGTNEQVDEDTGTLTSKSATLPNALSNSDSAVYAAFTHNTNERHAATDGTELGDTGHSGPTRNMSTVYQVNDLTVATGWATGSSVALSAAIEVVAAVAGGTDATVSVPVATVSVAGVVPVVVRSSTITVPSAGITVAGVAPAVVSSSTLSVPVATVTVAGVVLSVVSSSTISIPVATASVAGAVAVVSVSKSISVPLATVSVAAGTVTRNWRYPAEDLYPSTGIFPGEIESVNSTVSVPLADISVAADIPALVAGSTLSIPAATVTVAGVAPSVVRSSSLSVPVATVTVAGIAPTVGVPITVTVAVTLATVSVAGVVPTGGQTAWPGLELVPITEDALTLGAM